MGFFGGGSSVDLASPPAIGNTTPNTAAFTTLSANNGTITTSSPALTLAQTWNAGAVSFTAIQANITDTSSASGSYLLDLQVGGSTKFRIGKGSVHYLGGNFVNGGTALECYASEATALSRTVSSRVVFFGQESNVGMAMSAGYGISWSSNAAGSGDCFASRDLFLLRDAANTLAQRNSTNAQTFRLYNTFTDASNYERGFMRWATNVLEIGAEAAGTGTQRQLRFPLGTVTASTPLSITQTWNSAGVTFTGLQLNATDTASASGSLLMDLQVGGTSQFSVAKTGTAWVTSNNGIFQIGTNSQVGMLRSGGALNLFQAGTSYFQINAGNIIISASSVFGWNSTSVGSGTFDLQLTRDASDILAQRRSTNAQTFRLYRTFTDASNYERLGFLATNTTRYTITSENAGTGSARSLEVSFYTAASDPTSTDITSGCFSVWKNSGTGTIKLWANDGGTMKSVALA